MFKKILKWFGAIVLLLVGGVTIATGFRQHLEYDAPFPFVKASKDSAVIERGRNIVFGPAHCVACHSTDANKDSLLQAGIDPVLSGGYLFDLPFGKLYSRNITSDTATGIGKYTDMEIGRIIRYGVHANGEVVLPFMTYQHMTDDDLSAVISYLRSTKPVKKEIPLPEFTVMGKVLKAFILKPLGPTEKVEKTITPDTSAAYGRYLVSNVANCGACHTKRDGVGQFVGEPLAGGNPFIEPGKDTLTPPNLTPHATGRLNSWTKEIFIARFRMGKLIEHSHMPWSSYSRMSDDDLTAIWNYLGSLKPVKTEEVKN
ncbi:cytochrome c [Flavihumibacter solisilvae]|uniref:Cytochrome c domain-containing protein n=1 Tax=Flavihumibacter solisilvae TaxID=1349421 RepID=A0A0C1ISH8_9BACT|nr:c-type cytochrome [Flavihumibacter solisilvae]KIC93399.1 hypothetical protein OI18_16600 [Flavihumibacter solisilvae]